jgi:3-phosphoshikimate 1-carboxyvinyltransferase
MQAAIITTSLQGESQTLSIQKPASGLSLRGRIRVPGDKSISHRALMLGAIARGETTIEGLLLGEDPRSTAKCFSLLGASVSELNAERVTVRGVGIGELQEPVEVLDDVGNFSVSSGAFFCGNG